MPFKQSEFHTAPQDPIDPTAIEMLKYATEAFKNVDSNFFEGLHDAAYKIGDYILNKNYAEIKDSWIRGESIKVWDLKEVTPKEIDENEKEAPKNQWKNEEAFEEMPEIRESYLPTGATKRDETKELKWFPTWVMANVDVQKVKREIPIEKIPDLIEGFYATISKMYGEMAHNELREATPMVPIEWYSNQDDYIYNVVKLNKMNKWWFSQKNAASTQIPIAGNFTTATIMVHELMHRFITINDEIGMYQPEKLIETEKYKLAEKMPDFANDLLLGETCSIYAELLFADYIKEKYPEADTFDFLNKYRLSDFTVLKKLDIGFIEDLDKWLKLAKEYPNTQALTNMQKEEVTSFVRSTPEYRETTIIPEMYTTDLVSRFSHIFGYMFASHLHERTLKGELNPQDVLEKCTKAYTYSHSDEKEQMKLLEELGVPFIKEGKFVMDKETVDVFYEDTITNIERIAKANKRNAKFLSLESIKRAVSKNKLVKKLTEKEER